MYICNYFLRHEFFSIWLFNVKYGLTILFS